MQRKEHIIIKVTELEKQKIKEKAEKECLTISAYIRQKLCK